MDTEEEIIIDTKTLLHTHTYRHIHIVQYVCVILSKLKIEFKLDNFGREN